MGVCAFTRVCSGHPTFVVSSLRCGKLTLIMCFGKEFRKLILIVMSQEQSRNLISFEGGEFQFNCKHIPHKLACLLL